MNAEVVRVFPLEWSSYFKCFQVRFRCRCPSCGRISKHGEGFSVKPQKLILNGYRQCDHCHTDYPFEWKQQ